MTSDTLDLPAALTDVRRAYRLVHAYQRRMLDLLQKVDEILAEGGLEFVRWDPLSYARPCRSGTPVFRRGQWAWDLLPGYRFHCQWEAGPTDITGSRKVSVQPVADTGFEKSGREPEPGEFRGVDDCGTQMWIGLWATDSDEPKWGSAWTAAQEVVTPHDGEAHDVEVEGVSYTYQYLHVDVASLTDPEATEGMLFTPLREWLGVEG